MKRELSKVIASQLEKIIFPTRVYRFIGSQYLEIKSAWSHYSH